MNNNLISRSRTRNPKDSIHCDLLRRLNVLLIVFQVSHQACLSSLMLNCSPDCISFALSIRQKQLPSFLSKSDEERTLKRNFPLLFVIENLELLPMCQE